MIASSLPTSYYFIQLSELLKIDRGYESLPKPIQDDEISDAASELRKVEVEEDYDLDSDDYQIALERLDRMYNERLSLGFTDKVLPELPEELIEKRRKTFNQIQHLLRKCRTCESWDEDRSEYKLPQWLENVPEEMIKFTSLSKLFKIEKNLTRYLLIHQEMDDDLADR